MTEYWPALRSHALAAAAFGMIVAAVYTLVPNPPALVLMGLAVAYVLFLNRIITARLPPPPFARARKGSHKPVKNVGWKVTGWVLKTMALGMTVQLGAFVAAYTIVSYIIRIALVR